MYQKKIPKLIKAKRIESIRMLNEGTFQILKGRIGSLATFISQYENARKCMMDTMRSAIS
jgi:hypothetical protein